MELLAYFDVLRHRKVLVAVTMLVTLSVTVGVVMLRPPVYESSTLVRVKPYSANGVDYQTLQYADRITKTVIELVQSDFVTDLLADQLDADFEPAFSIAAIPGTELVRITATGNTPNEAHKIATTLTRIVLDLDAITGDSVGGENAAGIEALVVQTQAELDALTTQHRQFLTAVPIDIDQIDNLARSIDAANRRLEFLEDRYNLVLVAEAMRAETVSLVRAANLPDMPSSMSTRLAVLLGAVVGLGGGVLIAFVAESIDRRIYVSTQVPEMAADTHLFAVPPLPRRYSRILAKDHPAVEAYRQLAMSVTDANDKGTTRTMLITSAQPGEGKSTVTANLANALAERGFTTYVIDWNVRNPALHTWFNVPNHTGLSDLGRDYGLCSSDEFRKKVAQTVRRSASGVYVLSAGSPAFTRSQVFGVDFIRHLINVIADCADVLLIDTPAMLAVADAHMLLHATDSIVLVTRRAVTRQKALQQALDAINQHGSKLTGIILNGDFRGRRSSWYRHYGRVGVDLLRADRMQSERVHEYGAKEPSAPI